MPSSELTSLRINLADYPLTMAMKDGRVQSDLVRLDFCGPKTAHHGFKPMLRERAFEVGEIALVAFLQAKVYGKPFVLLPATISSRFVHHSIAFNKELGLLNPKDIEGRKVGITMYASTTGLWVRGVLQHEYGVDLDKVDWVTIEGAHLAEYQDPPNCERLPKGTNLGQMMLDGELAAALLGGREMPNDPRVETLIPDAAAAAKEWYQREGIKPINHILMVREELSRERPDVVREIFRMIVESRKFVPESETASLPPIGVEANRKSLETAIDWSFEQKIIPHRLSVDELFDETTAGLC
jgi:4,5-dihydroxyphthalate decarboxylase